MKFDDAQRNAVAMFDSKEFKKRVMEEDATMLKYLSILKDINARGLLTTESQAGKHEKGTNPDTGKKYDIRERAYITGYMQPALAERFIKHMGIYTDKVAAHIPVCANDTSIPSALDIPLTIQMRDGKPEVATHTSMAIPHGADEMFRKGVRLNKRDAAVHIVCWDPVWGRLADGKHGLFTDVLRILQGL